MASGKRRTAIPDNNGQKEQFNHLSEKITFMVLDKLMGDDIVVYFKQYARVSKARARVAYYLPDSMTYVSLTTCYEGPAPNRHMKRKADRAESMARAATAAVKDDFRVVHIDGRLYRRLAEGDPGAIARLGRMLKRAGDEVSDSKVKTLTEPVSAKVRTRSEGRPHQQYKPKVRKRRVQRVPIYA